MPLDLVLTLHAPTLETQRDSRRGVAATREIRSNRQKSSPELGVTRETSRLGVEILDSNRENRDARPEIWRKQAKSESRVHCDSIQNRFGEARLESAPKI